MNLPHGAKKGVFFPQVVVFSPNHLSKREWNLQTKTVHCISMNGHVDERIERVCAFPINGFTPV